MKPISDDCREFQDRLADFLEGRLLPEDHPAAENHLRSCQRCRGLLRIAEGTLDLLSATEHNELTRAILDRTSGSVCGRTREKMSDYLEGSLGSVDRQLLEQHMEHCSLCKAVFETMQRLVTVLAEMSELEPGKSFARDVIRATSRVPGASTGWLERLKRWWGEQLAKPIVQWEAAYVGALLLVATFGVPGSPLKGLPAHVTASFHQAAISLIPRSTVEVAKSEMTSFGTELWQSTGGRVIRAKETLGHRVEEKQRRIEPHLAAFKTHARLFGDAVMETDIVQGALHLGEMQRALKRMWCDVRHGDEPTPDQDGAERRMERPPPTVTS
jgi:predicted anti-sigma-YlaC factor YlaD